MSKTRLAILAALAMAALSVREVLAAPPTSRPNIIFILADDK
ncbi:MAG: hypothetical protein U0941_11310 [Planctomycetaceae bacterium]